METQDDSLLWYKDAVIYELHIKAFCDGNGDGIGDFQGLMQKLDYLQDLGVTAIWLLPFYPSPLKDDGYDIADYYNINPSYGDIPQFSHFLKEAHRRGLKVITELVVNHTSDQHPWFQRARQMPKGSKDRNYYVWTDDPTQYKDVRIIFQDFETSNWTWDPVAGQYYWHRFFSHQPDLNFDSPQVQAEVFRIINFWCRLGVDGFRLDAIPYLFEREGTNGENLPETHSFLKKLRQHVDEHFPGTVFLAEANMWPEDSVSYFGAGDECHMNYHFPVMPRMFMALQMEDRYPLTDIFDQTPDIPSNCQWALFLRNHDELTLEMVTDEERDYMYQAYARDPKAKINMGIRHRLAPLLENNRRKMELMNALLLSLPGTPVLYYGDEIGMGDNFYLGDRDGVRTPMQWSPDRNAGFSSTNPQRLYLPLILDPEYHYEAVNVETQRANTSSLFWYMKRIIAVRKRFKTFGRGDLKFLQVENPKVLAFTRTYKEETLLVIVNLSKFSQAAEIDLSAHKGYIPVDVFSNNRFPVIKEEGFYFFTLAPYAFQWFALEKAHPDMDEQATLPLLILRSWEGAGGGAANGGSGANGGGLMGLESKRILETSILPHYLPGVKWYVEEQRPIYAVNISSFTRMEFVVGAARGSGGIAAASKEPSGVPVQTLYWLLVDVSYQSGPPALYQLPVLLLTGERAESFRKTCPKGVIAQVKTVEADGLMVDAFFVPECQVELIKRMADGKNARARSGPQRDLARSRGREPGKIVFSADGQLHRHMEASDDPKPKLHVSDEYNTAITYDGRFFLKMYRKPDPGINPDLEMAQFLSDDAQFKHIPAFVGSISWKDDQNPIVLGIMQEMVEDHGNGYLFFEERINNYIERLVAADGAHPFNPEERLGTLAEPMAFAELPEVLQVAIGGHAAELAHLIGVRAAGMHLALASVAAMGSKDFRPEPFSLYYQRSLYSSLQSLVRETYQHLTARMSKLPPSVQARKERMLAYRPELLNTLKKIYARKLDALKTRVHGGFRLENVLLTGKDLAIQNFGGDPSRPASERRLKHSPFTDLASMVASIHTVAYEGFLQDRKTVEFKIDELLPFAPCWAHYISGFFIKAWFETVDAASKPSTSLLIPAAKEERIRVWQTYLLAQAIEDFNRAVLKNPDRVQIPLAVMREALLMSGAPSAAATSDRPASAATGTSAAAATV